MVLIHVSGTTYDTTPDHGMVNVDPEFLESLSQVRLSWTPQGYCQIYKRQPNGNVLRALLHNYIFVNIRGMVIPEGMMLHHIRNDKWDNSMNNLELTNQAHVSAAVDKKNEKSTSQYKGVSFSSRDNVWRAQIVSNKQNIFLGSFDDELDAAKMYDRAYTALHRSINGSNLLLDPLEIETILNNPELFKPQPKRAGRELPKNISVVGNGFRVRIEYNGEVRQRQFGSLADAVIFRDSALREMEEKRANKLKETPILRNEEGIAIIPVKLFNSDDVVFTKVSDCDYYALLEHKWYLNRGGYVWSKFGEMQCVILQNSNKNKVVDHINHDKIDNQRENLRVVSWILSNRNKRKQEGKSSQYIGVSFHKQSNRWRARMKTNGRERSLGYFDTEEEAKDAYQEEYNRLENLEHN